MERYKKFFETQINSYSEFENIAWDEAKSIEGSFYRYPHRDATLSEKEKFFKSNKELLLQNHKYWERHNVGIIFISNVIDNIVRKYLKAQKVTSYDDHGGFVLD